MPLVRLQVRNEYGLGKPELYNEVNREDPKAILDGVAVAGLVGILRQLGDLAEFAAEVFHGLQEQVTTTASRSHKLSLRAQRIEAALPPLEKAALSQTSHLHFAYTAGSDWHTTIRNRQHHFIDNDLPRFIMDSYEECHDPPHLHMLDKFDTGGPGSCLRRYSDPTFFRRVSASPDEVNAIKVRGDKRTRKIKKRRSFPRNREFSRGVPVTTHSGRMHFASPIMNGQSSPTASMADSTFKSDFGDHRGTDYRPGSGYVECIFRASNEMQPDEQESNRSSSSRVMLQEEAADSVSPYEETQVVDYYPPKEISESCITSNSCPVMWDEKTEITEPREQICNEIEDSATISVTPGTGVGEAGNFENVDVSDINLCCDGNTSKPNIHENQIDDIDSEPDNYEDALNTIESEPENDVECQTKREVERHSTSVDIEEIKVALNELTSQASNSHTSRRESDTISFVAPNDGLSTQLPKSASSETYEQADMCQIPQVLSNSVCSPVTKDQNTDLLDGTKLESFDGNSSSRVFTLPHDEVTSSICGDQESSSEHIGVKFWTNGGLLGLEPSKPPDFAASSAQNCNFGMRNNDDHCERNVNMSTENVDSIVDSIESKAGSKCSSPFKISKNGVPADGTSMVSSPADLNCKFGMSEDQRYRSGHPSGDCLRSVSVLAPRIAVPVVPSAKVAHSESVEENSENHGVFGLGHKLLMNSFRRKLSLVNDEEGKSFDTVNASVLEQSYGKHEPSCQKITGRNSLGQFQSVSPTISLPPSPPIEHMKISFHPLNGFETSRLTLKFPHDKNRHESSKDMFTSFQLVPEPAVQLHDFCSDSDDGTFCRSSLYISDDCLSRHSESGSEQWESSETPISEDNGHHGALCSFSPTESTSTSGEHGRMANCKTRADGEHEFLQTENGQQPLLSFSGYAYVPSLDLPSFDSMESVSMEDKDVGCDAKNYDELHHPQTVPLPPPLPPVEQWILKPHLNAEEAQKHTLLEPLNDKPVSKNFVSRIFQQPKQAAALQNHVVEEASEVTLNRKDQQESKTYGEANQGSKVEQMDEKEDFLHQIRTKSFNLRRTGTARSTGAAAQAASVNVTAILEKANAIRQAVGSDDGDENDNWSDT